MTVQRLAEPSDLDARIAVLLRVEIFPPAEAIDCDRIGFDQGATAGLGFCDDEPEQPPHYRRTAKGWRRFNRGQFRSEERRGGNECVSRCRSRLSPNHEEKQQKTDIKVCRELRKQCMTLCRHTNIEKEI